MATGMACEVTASQAVPNLTAASPRYKSNVANVTNTPPATGALTSPQAPSGAVVTNTGRSTMAAAAFFAALPYRLYSPPLIPYVPPR